jgi:hypothetical protein
MTHLTPYSLVVGKDHGLRILFALAASLLSSPSSVHLHTFAFPRLQLDI